jgi:hypothetical protein
MRLTDSEIRAKIRTRIELLKEVLPNLCPEIKKVTTETRIRELEWVLRKVIK